MNYNMNDKELLTKYGFYNKNGSTFNKNGYCVDIDLAINDCKEVEDKRSNSIYYRVKNKLNIKTKKQ